MYETIITLLQKEVDAIAAKEWSCDDHPPFFMVSLLNDNVKDQKILLTVAHGGEVFSTVIFPIDKTDVRYGYDTIYQMMKYLYNRTV